MAASSGELNQEERDLFDPIAAVLALRDSRYRHPANAIAELIDNSIDAHAWKVDLLIKEVQEVVRTRKSWRVSELAVLDNGDGMDAETLVQALRFGGRKPSSQVQAIGKYGMGLPTASASQCKKVEVWTWQESIERPTYSCLDINRVEEGDRLIPAPVVRPIPPEWRGLIDADTVNTDHGTLVLWSDIDRIRARASTIFSRVEKELGRIHRNFIDSGELAIRMATFREGSVDQPYKAVRPNDPLFLMKNSSTSDPWGEEPMFREYKPSVYRTFAVDGGEEEVEISYSIVEAEALGKQRQNPGALPHGKDALANMGVSIVRENRELLLEDAFVREGGRGDEPMNRWWGCEIRFSKGCDDIFGVDHNKQMAEIISNAAKEIANAEENSDEVLGKLDQEGNEVYEMVNEIYSTIRSMFRDIKVMYEQRRTERKKGGKKEATPEEEAVQRASAAREDQLEAGDTPSRTDRAHAEMAPEARKEAIAEYLEEEDVSEPASRADQIVRNNFLYEFIPKELDGHQMFSVRSRGGVLFVHLNINHSLYEFLRFLEKRSDQWAHQAAVALRTLLLAWARMEDQTEQREHRQEVQRTAQRWGEHATAVLPQLSGEDSSDR